MDLENKDWILNALKNFGVKVPKIKNFKSSIPKQDENASQLDRNLFGVSLFKQEWTYESDYALPKFLTVTTTYLSKFSTTVGLFRKSGSIIRQKNLRMKLKNGESLEGSDPNDVASLLKQWLRELPEPLIPRSMHDLFIRCRQLGGEDCKNASLLSCLLLPPEHLYPLRHLLCFLKKFAMHSNENNMGEGNLALMLAPNIFTSKTGNTNMNKHCNSLVHLHASVIELLIKNADRIGEVPLAVSLRHPILNEKSESEFDSSSDMLDCGSSKLTKKLKVGPVQDVFSGIRKLVGQNTTSTPTEKTISPEKFCSSPKIPSRPVLLNDAGNTFSTPMQNEALQAFGIKPKPDCGQKKSLGFLRLKDRKRQNSMRLASQAKTNLEISDLNSAADPMDSMFKVPLSSNEPKRKSPRIQLENNKLKCESLAMCDPECNLATATKELFNLSTQYLQSSQDDSNVPNKAVEIELLETWKSEFLHRNAENDGCQNKTVNELDSLAMKRDHFENNVLHTTELSSSTFDTVSKNKEKYSACQMPSRNNSYRNDENRVDLHRSKSLIVSKWRSDGNGRTINSKTCKKTTRQHSLIRGKPNTIKNGLPYQHLNKRHLTQSLDIDNDTLYQSGYDTVANPCQNVSEKESNKYFSEQDISLILSFANLNVSPLSINSTPASNRRSSVISVPKNSPTPNKESFSVNTLNKDILSPLLSPGIFSPHSDSKIPRLRCALGTDQALSEFSPNNKQQTPRIRLSRSVRSPRNSRIPVLSKRKINLSDLELSLNDSCFLSPNQTSCTSFNSSTCESGNMFLTVSTPQGNYNKRESIAQILKNNYGHVLEKVQLYDSRDTKGCSTSSNASSNSCRVSPFEKSPLRSSQKRLSDKQKNRGNRKMSVKNRIGTPSKLPQHPSKYSINLEAHSQNISHPLKLKEVTNTTTDGKQNLSHNITPIKEDNPSQKSVTINNQNRCNADLRKVKLKRNSFSGHTPHKLSKRVSRSESMGSCPIV